MLARPSPAVRDPSSCKLESQLGRGGILAEVEGGVQTKVEGVQGSGMDFGMKSQGNGFGVGTGEKSDGDGWVEGLRDAWVEELSLEGHQGIVGQGRRYEGIVRQGPPGSISTVSGGGVFDSRGSLRATFRC
jgi:hypothetical protein